MFDFGVERDANNNNDEKKSTGGKATTPVPQAEPMEGIASSSLLLPVDEEIEGEVGYFHRPTSIGERQD